MSLDGDCNSDSAAPLQDLGASGRPGCTPELDAFGLHAASCNWGQVCKKHDKLRDHLAHAAREAGMAAITDHNMAIDADASGAVRGIHRADVRIIESDGRQLWVDVLVAPSTG